MSQIMECSGAAWERVLMENSTICKHSPLKAIHKLLHYTSFRNYSLFLSIAAPRNFPTEGKSGSCSKPLG